MDTKETKKKSFELSLIEHGKSDLDLINEHTIKPLYADDVYTFKVVLCDNDIDRVNDKMSNEFLNEFAESSKGLTGLKDHDWDMDNQISRLYDTEVVVDNTKLNKLGEPKVSVVGKAYTLTKYNDYIDKINAGLIKEASVSFDSVGDTCSICGAVTHKGPDDVAICPNGHIMGEVYDDKLCYNNVTKLKESYEWSLVAVPCQRNSGIKNKSLLNGGIDIMKKSKLMLQKLVNSKAFKAASEEEKKEIEDIDNPENDVELTDEEIKAIVAENTNLKSKIESLEDKIKEIEGGRVRDKLESIVSKAVDDMEPLTPVVKENIMRDIDFDKLKMNGDKVDGLDGVMTEMKAKYKGLYNEESDEPDEEDEPDEDDETKEKEMDEPEDGMKTKGCGVKSKSMKHNSGISFGVNNAKKKSIGNTKIGISIN